MHTSTQTGTPLRTKGCRGTSANQCKVLDPGCCGTNCRCCLDCSRSGPVQELTFVAGQSPPDPDSPWERRGHFGTLGGDQGRSCAQHQGQHGQGLAMSEWSRQFRNTAFSAFEAKFFVKERSSGESCPTFAHGACGRVPPVARTEMQERGLKCRP
jgi:hypothetical protein